MDLQRLSRLQPDVTVPEDAEIWDLTSEEAGRAIETLAADTARDILSKLYRQPRTASELAKATDHSLQNVNYHLKNLTEAELIEVADTRYSAKGTEMKIYAPTTNAVLLLSQESTATRIKQLLARLVSGVGAIAIGAIVFRSLMVGAPIGFPEFGLAGGDDDADDADDLIAADDDVDDDAPEVEDLDSYRTTEGQVEAQPEADVVAQVVEQLPFLLDPGVVFFLGGLLVLLVFLGYGYWQGRY